MPKTTPPLERLMRHVEKKPDGCWMWTGATLPNGYPRFNYGSGYAHRSAYELMVGPIPDGMTIDHLCNVPACVNPEHLRVASHRANILRSNNLAARNARKTHCNHGHEFTAENTYVTVRGEATHRRCATCNREQSLKRYYARKAS